MAAVTPSMLAVTVSVRAICSPAWSMAALARSISRSPRSRRPATAAEVSDISRAAFSMTYTATPIPTTKAAAAATTAAQTAVSMPESPPARPYRLYTRGQGPADAGAPRVGGHGPGRPARDVARRRVDRLDHGVRLRRQGQMDGRLGQVDPGLGQPDELHRVRGRDRHAERRRVGHPDVLARVHDQPPGDEARVLPRLDHPGQVVQRGVGVAAADALDERADDVVMLVA